MFGVKDVPCPVEIKSVDVIPPAKSGGTPHLSLSFLNKSEFVITGIELVVTCFDSEGKKIGVVKSGVNSDSKLMVIVSNSAPGQVFGQNRVYPLLAGTTKVEVAVNYVLFEDGSEWDIAAPKKIFYKKAAMFSAVLFIAIALAAAILIGFIIYFRVQNLNSTMFNDAVGFLKQKQVYEAMAKLEIISDYGRAKELLNSISGEFEFSDNYIYYADTKQDNKLYRMNYDATGIKKLCDDKVGAFVIRGEYIYYINKSDTNRIYRIGTDGSGKIRICGDSTDEMVLSGGYVLYCNLNDGHKIYRINADGSGKIKVNDDYSVSMAVFGDHIIYSNRNDMGKIYVLKPDGSDYRKLVDIPASVIKSDNSLIYFINEKDDNKLYSVDFGGTALKMLSLDPSSDVSLFGNNVYFLNNRDNRFYKVNINGESVPVK